MIALTVIALTPHMPEKGYPPSLYSNQTRNDLKLTMNRAISMAKKSIFLEMFSLSDDNIINALKKKADAGVNITIVLDKNYARKAMRLLSDHASITVGNCKGLMHKKILIIDNTMVWIGSSNMTTESLRMHDNLLIGVHSPELAKTITANTPSHEHIVGGQHIEYWSLPTDGSAAVKHLIELIDAAHGRIRIAMFTWTNQDLANAVIAAKRRGIDIAVAIDYTSGHGASSNVITMLKNADIPTTLNQGLGLLHHKFAYIDDTILVNGSANWTKAAFNKNADCFLVLHNLTPNQQKFMNNLWSVIDAETR